ncbi:MAG: HD domain-containing protein [Candidatus Omnitrophica bacterium]|nr:HD domain-containing protein [Candidatus Omnitrophota bacterium]
MATVLIPVLTFFLGIFLGYSLFHHQGREKMHRMFERIERRNIWRTVNALVSAIDFKDNLTKRHSDNVKHYALAIAAAMNVPAADVKTLRDACRLHDLSKIGVHDHILTKPGVLSAEEEHEMRLHSLAGAVILKPFGFLQAAVRLIRQHHERYDGSGYPDGLSGEEISLGARSTGHRSGNSRTVIVIFRCSG